MRLAHTSYNLVAYIFLSRRLYVHAVLVNVTIDDTLGDPKTGELVSYSPPGAWNDGTDCSACTLSPNASMLYDGTWHDGVFDADVNETSNDFPNTVLTASVSFNGTSVYVFCALAPANQSPDGDSDMTFHIDGSVVGTFVHSDPGTSVFQYNACVYSNTSLSPGIHQIELQNGRPHGNKSLAILDSIVYTFDDGAPDSVTTSMTEAQSHDHRVQGTTIAGIVIGALIALCIIGIIIFLRRRHRRTAEALSEQLLPIAFTGHEDVINSNVITTASASVKITRFPPKSPRKKDHYPSPVSREPLPPLPSGTLAWQLSDTPPAYNFKTS